MSEDERARLIKVENLERYSRNVDTVVKVVSKTEPRRVTSRRDLSTHKVCEALVGDETGSIYLVLWDDDIDDINEGQILEIKNAYIKIFRGSMQLNLGREGVYETLEEAPFEEVKTENNLSSKVFERDRGYRRPFRGRSKRRY
jgi:replication factor A1